MSKWNRSLLVVVMLVSCNFDSASTTSQETRHPQHVQGHSTAPFTEPFDPAGSLILVGGGSLPPEIRNRIAEAGGAGKPKSCLILIPTSSTYAEVEKPDYWKEPWLDCGFESIEILHTRDRAVADSKEFNEPLTRATAVWVSGGDQSLFAAAYAGTRTEATLRDVLARGGVVSGTSAGAAMASRIMIADGRDDPVMGTGLDLLPNAIVDQHFANRNRIGRLKKAVAKHPTCVGIGIDESTAAVFHRRSLAIMGEGNVRVIMAATDFAPEEMTILKPGKQWLDWTTLVRHARERSLPPFPPANLQETKIPFVEKGALLIVGGGQMSSEMWETFVTKAGGKQAKIVILPTGMSLPDPKPKEAQILQQLGVEKVTVLADIDRESIKRPEYLEALETATGIWFGGGRQWRFVDAYEGTEALKLMHNCLERGGVIGGSSAGASIQGELLIRGAPVGNHILVQDGYRKGFGFLPGAAIDQHFSQRNRLPDLKQAVRRYPNFLGLGVDEGTAILIEKSNAKVIGTGQVFAIGMQDRLRLFSNAERSSAEEGVRNDGIQAIEETDLKLIHAQGGQTIDLGRFAVVSE